jgi:hypothetical protein
MTFSLHKWYVDVVTEDKRVGIAYRAEIRHGPLRLELAGVLVHVGAADATPTWRFSMHHTALPARHEQGLRWAAPRICLDVECESNEPAFEQRLMETSEGAIDWSCVFPRARVRLSTGDAVLEGLGYVEHLAVVGIAPWCIPADEIRWGRFLTDTTSIVWIDWRGDSPRRFVFRDGRAVTTTELTDGRIVLADGVELMLRDPKVIDADTLGDLLGPLEPLRALVRPLARTHQTRWCSSGELRGPDGATQTGRALHELLRR